MKVLLTGANGFVGSHVLERLCARAIETAVILRPNSNRAFVEGLLPRVQVHVGSLFEPATLAAALKGVTHVVHCAGAVRALREEEFFQVNQMGTHHVVAACNEQLEHVRRLVYFSSLAAAGPGSRAAPAREDAAPQPISAYGRSKLAGEKEVREGCRAEFVILRPPAVYGPRDGEFLRLFRAIGRHVRPVFGGGGQALSLVFAEDLAEAAVHALSHPAVAGRTYNVAAEEVVSAGELAGEISRQMGSWTVPVPLPPAALWPICWVQEMISRWTGKANVLSRQKYAELRAEGWVCDPSRWRQDTGLVCETHLRDGVAKTLAWYRQHHWL